MSCRMRVDGASQGKSAAMKPGCDRMSGVSKLETWT